MKKALYFLITIFSINLVGLYYQLYLHYSWFDQVLHFSGGLFVAMFFSAYLKEHLFNNTKIKNALIVVGVTVFIGVLWEFAEYIANLVASPIIYDYSGVRTYFMGDLADTINDLLMDTLGACTLFVLHLFGSRKNHQI